MCSIKKIKGKEELTGSLFKETGRIKIGRYWLKVSKEFSFLVQKKR